VDVDARTGRTEADVLTRQENIVVEGQRRIGRCRTVSTDTGRSSIFGALGEHLRNKQRVGAAAKGTLSARCGLIVTPGLGVTGGGDTRCSAVLSHRRAVIAAIGIRRCRRKRRAANGVVSERTQAGSVFGGACVRSDCGWKVECHFASRVAIT